ncbi:helix-turn-helix transcriptional regulator [Gluconacetobacter sp.]|uniref:helix-turn-helix transcriptional regulator n=1 Tax=Gluconacetobacter sp. TaxID=1935994 RepID=UPI0039E8E72E
MKVRTELKAYRAARGWTQAELAERVGVSRKTINTVENGIFTPSVALALLLADCLEATVEDLFQIVPEATGPA